MIEPLSEATARRRNVGQSPPTSGVSALQASTHCMSAALRRRRLSTGSNDRLKFLRLTRPMSSCQTIRSIALFGISPR